MMDEQEIRQALQLLEDNPDMVTESSFRANGDRWPDNTASFADRHIEYLKLHPKTDPAPYIANLRLWIRKSR